MYEDQTVDSYVEIDEEIEEEDDLGEDPKRATAAQALISRTLNLERKHREAEYTAESLGRAAVIYSVKTKPLAWKDAYDILTNVDLNAVTPVKPFRPAGGNIYIYDPSAHEFKKSAWRGDGYFWDTTYGGANLYPSKIAKSDSLVKKLLWPLNKADKRFVRYEWLLTDKSLQALNMKTSYVLVHYVGDETVFKSTGRRTRFRNPINPYQAISQSRNESSTNLSKSPEKDAATSCLSSILRNGFKSSPQTLSQKRKFPEEPTSSDTNGAYEHTYFVQAKTSKAPPVLTMEPNTSSRLEELHMKLLVQEFDLKKQLIKKKMDAADAKKKYYEALTNQTVVHQY